MLEKLKAIVHVLKSLRSFAAAMLFWSKWSLIIIDEISFKVVEGGNFLPAEYSAIPLRQARGSGEL